MVGEGAVGEKTGRGFFQKVRSTDGSEIHVRDIAGGRYAARQKVRFAAVDTAKSIEDLRTRIKTLFLSQDRAGEFLRATLGPTLLYAARIAPEVAESIDDVDRAMRWGFGWDLGPFETWDAIGLPEVLKALDVAGDDTPPLAASAIAAGRPTFRNGLVPPARSDYGLIRRANERGAPIRRNAGASLLDLGDGVLLVNLHSKMNAIGGDTLDMLEAGVAA